MWTCDQCGLSLPFDPKPPVVCRCKNDDRLVTIQLTGDDLPAPTSDRCIVTVAAGDIASTMWRHTRVPMREYADRTGADFVELLGDQCPEYGFANKFRVHQVGKRYDRTLFIDADAWIMPHCVNLFDHYPAGACYFYDDRPFLKCETWLANELRWLCDLHDLPPLNERKCLNSGVVLFDRQHADMWQAPAKPLPKTPCMEQNHVMLMAHLLGHDIRPLDITHNLQWWIRPRWKRLKSTAEILHWSGCPNKIRINEIARLASCGGK